MANRKPRSGRSGNRTNSNSNRGNNRSSADYSNPAVSESTGANSSSIGSLYAASAQLLKDAGSHSFNNPTGDPVDLGVPCYGGSTTLQAFPGILAVNTMIIPGIASSNDDPINVAARNNYTFVRKGNSGAANYDPAEQMMVFQAMDSIYTLWYECKRTYGIINTYSQYNKYIPDALCRAVGVDPSNLRLNLANFRYRLNVIANKIRQIPYPKSMKITDRHIELFSNVYADARNDKAALYLFNLNNVWQLMNPTPSGGNIRCENQNLGAPGGTAPYTTKLNKLEQLIASVNSNLEIGNITGDINKVYDASGLRSIEDVPEDYKVHPTYDEYVLNQIHNSVSLDSVTLSDIGSDTETGLITFSVSATGSTQLNNCNKIIDMPNDDPTPGEVMDATRLTQSVSSVAVTPSAGVYQYTINTTGSEIVQGYYLIYNVVTGSSKTLTFNRIVSNQQGDDWYGSTGRISNALLEQFDWHPLIYTEDQMADETVALLPIQGDISNYTTFSNFDLSKLNQTAMLSLYDVPVNR